MFAVPPSFSSPRRWALAAGLSLSLLAGCQTPAPLTPAAGAGVQTASDVSLAPSTPEPLVFVAVNGVAREGGQPIADAPVRVVDAATGAPAAAEVQPGLDALVVRGELKTDAAGRFRFEVARLVPGRAVRVIVQGPAGPVVTMLSGEGRAPAAVGYHLFDALDEQAAPLLVDETTTLLALAEAAGPSLAFDLPAATGAALIRNETTQLNGWASRFAEALSRQPERARQLLSEVDPQTGTLRLTPALLALEAEYELTRSLLLQAFAGDLAAGLATYERILARGGKLEAPFTPEDEAAVQARVGALLGQSAGAARSLQNVVGVSNSWSAGVADVKGRDLETAMMAVQSRRAELLEAQMKEQINAVQERNALIAVLSGVVATMRQNGATKVGPLLTPQLAQLGVTAETSLEELKGKIDAMSSSQQMDMLRLQSLSNKRNEAFELMTHFIKKMQDSRSSILGNMRYKVQASSALEQAEKAAIAQLEKILAGLGDELERRLATEAAALPHLLQDEAFNALLEDAGALDDVRRASLEAARLALESHPSSAAGQAPALAPVSEVLIPLEGTAAALTLSDTAGRIVAPTGSLELHVADPKQATQELDFAQGSPLLAPAKRQHATP